MIAMIRNVFSLPLSGAYLKMSMTPMKAPKKVMMSLIGLGMLVTELAVPVSCLRILKICSIVLCLFRLVSYLLLLENFLDGSVEVSGGRAIHHKIGDKHRQREPGEHKADYHHAAAWRLHEVPRIHAFISLGANLGV